MIAIILAAGLGTRLLPHTKNCPKAMVKINGMSLLERQLKIFNKYNFKNIYVISGYKNRAINEKKLGVKKILNKNYRKTNMVYSLFCAKKYFQDDVIISYGDILYSSNCLKKIITSKYNISVAIDKKWKHIGLQGATIHYLT